MTDETTSSYLFHCDGAVVFPEIECIGYDEYEGHIYQFPDMNYSYKYGLYDSQNKICLASTDAKTWRIAVGYEINGDSVAVEEIKADIERWVSTNK